jgi:hypothetical protein
MLELVMTEIRVTDIMTNILKMKNITGKITDIFQIVKVNLLINIKTGRLDFSLSLDLRAK